MRHDTSSPLTPTVLASPSITATLDPPRPSWLDHRLYPFPSRHIDVDGCRLHYVDEGDGPVLFFVHAAPAWSFIYRELVKALRSDFRCIAVDLPGFGLSTAAPSFGFRIPEFARVIASLVERLDLHHVTPVVHDSGGPIGLGAALLAPWRYHAFIISSSFGWPIQDHPAAHRMLRLVSSAPAGLILDTFNVLPWVISHVAPRSRRLSAAERRAYLRAFPTRASRARIRRVFRALTEDKPYFERLERSLQEQFSDLPCLLIYGERDPAVRFGFHTRFQRIFPRHRTVLVAREQHFPVEGAPGEMIAAIRDWWRGAGPQLEPGGTAAPQQGSGGTHATN